MLRQLQNIVRDAGLPGHWELHKWRKSYATLQARRNVDVKILQQRLGHSDIATTIAYLEGEDSRSERSRHLDFSADGSSVATLGRRPVVDATSGGEPGNDSRIRRRFPYADVARMWDEGKTIKQIGIAIDRLDKGSDPIHTMRNFLMRMHQIAYKDASGHRFKLPYRRV
jgi:hypothetical protein